MWPEKLYSAEQSRELDRLAIAGGIDGYALMCRAGVAAFNYLLRQWALPEKLHIVAGTGNNGGDGLVMARLAKERALPVTVYLLGDAGKIRNEAAQAYTAAVEAGVDIQPFSCDLVLTQGVIVDALLGTGLNGDVRSDYADAINCINRSALPVLALDVPSGLHSDHGQVLGCAVKADKTITFIAAKCGLFTGRGPEYAGEVLFEDLGIPRQLYAEVGEAIDHPCLAKLLDAMPKRPQDAHKGLYGHSLVIGGNYGMAGAVMMAAEAAARVGSGLVSVATQPEHVAAVLARRPELMVLGVVSGQELDPLLERPTVLVLGPGLGQTPWSDQMLQKAMKTALPMVVDADALNLLSERRVVKAPYRDNWVLTPHPGEAARLLGCSSAEVQADRLGAVKQLQQQYGGVVVLKGAGSLVADGQSVSLCSAGNPGMASGGMGDVLSGVIAGLLAQGLSQAAAARLGVALHAEAADNAAAAQGMVGLLATDLLGYLRPLLNGRYH